MGYLIIEKIPRGGFKIRAEIGGAMIAHLKFYGYSERAAVQEYRERAGLKNKHLAKIYL